MHEPPRLGKVKFEAEPLQVMMTSSALLAPGAPVMLSVPAAVTELPSHSRDVLSMSNVAAACTSLQWISVETSGLNLSFGMPSALTASFWHFVQVPKMTPCLQCTFVTKLGLCARK